MLHKYQKLNYYILPPQNKTTLYYQVDYLKQLPSKTSYIDFERFVYGGRFEYLDVFRIIIT